MTCTGTREWYSENGARLQSGGPGEDRGDAEKRERLSVDPRQTVDQCRGSGVARPDIVVLW